MLRRRHWYRLDLWSAIDRLQAFLAKVFGPANPIRRRLASSSPNEKLLSTRPDLSPLEFRNPPSEMIFSVVLPLAATAGRLATAEYFASAQAVADKQAAENLGAAASSRQGTHYDTSPQGWVVGPGRDASGEDTVINRGRSDDDNGDFADRGGLDGLDGWSGSVQDYDLSLAGWLPSADLIARSGDVSGGADGGHANSPSGSSGADIPGGAFGGNLSSGATDDFADPSLVGTESNGTVGAGAESLSSSVTGGRTGVATRGAALRPGAPGSGQPMFLQNNADAPVRFIANVGQWTSAVDFGTRGDGYQAWFTRNAVVLALARLPAEGTERQEATTGVVYDAVRLEWNGVRGETQAAGEGQIQSVSNFLFDNNPEAWHTGVTEYSSIRYTNAWSGTDIVYRRADGNGLAYDIHVRPGALPQVPAFRVVGAEADVVEGRLVLTTPSGNEVATSAPVAYQRAVDGSRETVSGSYHMRGDGLIGFTVGAYDASRELVIDPPIVYDPGIGGSGTETASAVKPGPNGTSYVTGWTTSSNLPGISGTYDTSYNGNTDAFLSQIDSDGSVMWSTYLGGSGTDKAYGLDLDRDGNLYVAGTTSSASNNFPTTGGAYITSPPGGDDGFAAKLNSTGTSLIYSTYLGGTGTDRAWGIAVDRLSGEAVVVGSTTSTAYPTVNADQSSRAGLQDAFITRLNAGGTGAVFSTYLGGSSGDPDLGILAKSEARGVAVDRAGDAIVVGYTPTSNFPVRNAYQSTYGGAYDAFLARYSDKGVRIASTYYGDAGEERAYAVSLDARDYIYVTGVGVSARFRTLSGAPDYDTGADGNAVAADDQRRAVVVGTSGGAITITRLTPTGSGTEWSTTWGSGGAAGYGVAVSGAYILASGEDGSGDAALPAYGPPAAPVITGLTDDTGASNSDRVTNDTTPTLTGTAVGSASITVYKKGPNDPIPMFSGTTTASTGGLWTYTYGTALPHGRYELSARASVSGEVSASSALLSATIDTAAPLGGIRVEQSYDTKPPVLLAAKDTYASPTTATLDVDLNNDGNFTGGEVGYATAAFDNGRALFTGYTALTAGSTVRFRGRVTDLAGNEMSAVSPPTLIAPTPNPWTATDLTWRTRSGHGLLSSGNVTAYHALDLDKSPFATDGQDPYLVYHSQEASPAPMVQAVLQSDNALGIPLHVYGTLTWDGAQVGGVDYSLTGLSPGGEWVFSYAPTGTPATGRHTYSLNLFVDYTGSANDHAVTVAGDTFVVNRASSPYGAGWAFSNTDALVTIASSGSYPAGVLRLHGGGAWSFYTDAGSGQYTEPAGDAGSLVASGGTWTYTSADGRLLSFDSSGRMASRKDLANTETLTYTYDGAGTGTAARVATVTNPDGGVATFAYSGSLLATITAPGNRVTTFSYTGSDLTQVTNPAAGAHTFTYSSSRLTGETYGAANVTYAYDSGLVSSMTLGAASTVTPSFKTGITTGVTAGPSHSAAGTYTDALGEVWKSWFNAFGQVVKTQDPVGAVNTFERNANGFVTKFADALERVTTYTVDSAGRVTNEARPDGTSASWVYGGAYGSLTKYTDYRGGDYTFTNNSNSNRLTTTDPLNHTTTFTYSSGLLETAKDATGNVITFSYDASRRPSGALLGGAVTGTVGYDSAGNPATYTDALGNVSTMTFDGAGRVVGTINPLGQRTTVSFDAGGFIKWMSDGLGHITSFAYDSAGRITAVIEAHGTSLERRTTAVYDAAGQLTAVVDPLGNRTTAVYDEAGQTIGVVNVLGKQRLYAYDLAGQLTSTVDELGRTASYGYDQLGRLQTMTDPLGNVTSVIYDANSNTTAVVDPLGNRTSYGYDAADRLITVTNPLNKVTSYGYDNADRFITVTDPLGNVTSAVYDSRNRVSEVVNALGKRVTFGYDAADNRVTTKDPLNHVTSTVFDTLNRSVGSIDALGNRSTITLDADGKVIESIDPLNHVTTIVYDELDRAIAAVDALGNRTTVVYDAADRVTAVVDPLGNRTSYVLDALGRVAASIDPLRNRTSFTFDAAGQLTGTQDALGWRMTAGYDALGRAVSVTDYLGNVWTTTYDAAGRIVSSTDPNNHTDTIVYDNASQVIATVDALGNRTSYGYDFAGNTTSMTDPLNHITTLVYDALNHPKALENALNQRSTVVYDDAGNMIAYEDALNRRTTWGYDAADRRITTTDPLGGIWTVGYDAASNVTSYTDPLNHTTTLVYDEVNRVKAVVDALTNRTTGTYDAAGNLKTVTDALNHVATLAYDARNMPVTTTDALGNVWTTQYDATGRLWRQIDPLGRDIRSYAEGGDVVDSADGYGFREETVYDDAGNVIARSDTLGNRTTFGYDAADRLITIRHALNGVTTVAYDTGGNTTALTDPVGNTTTWAYDVLNRVSTETDPTNATTTLTYTAAGQLSSTTDRLGRRKDFDYYANGQLKTEKWYASGGALTQTQTLTYDAAWRQLTAQDPDGTYTLGYDNANRVTRVDEPFGLVLTFGYDALGNRTKVEDSKGGLATITFDNANRQLTEELSGTNITKVKETRSYTAAGELSLVTRQTWSGGAYSTAGTTSYAYDNDFRNTRITHFGSGGAVLASYVYAYDAGDRLTSETINGTLRTYSYDATDQLTADAGTVYSYDLNGNRNMSGYSTGAANRVTTDGTWSYTYDAEGNVTKRSKGASSDTWNYTYDNNNQMLTASFSATDGGAATTRVTFAYDAFGNKLQRQAWNGSTTTERYGYDGWDPAKPPALANEGFDAWADMDGSNALTSRRLHGPEFDDMTLREDSSGTVGWYLTDLLGSVRGVTDGSGTPLTTISYTGWGAISSNSTPAQSDRFQYEAAVCDGTLGLRDHRARVTNGWMWMSEDPIGFNAGDPNLRRVEGNGPTNAIDPSGLYAGNVGNETGQEPGGTQTDERTHKLHFLQAYLEWLTQPLGPGRLAIFQLPKAIREFPGPVTFAELQVLQAIESLVLALPANAFPSEASRTAILNEITNQIRLGFKWTQSPPAIAVGGGGMIIGAIPNRQELLQELDALIAQLGASEYQDREEAHAALNNMISRYLLQGAMEGDLSISTILHYRLLEHYNTHNLQETRNRIGRILDQTKKSILNLRSMLEEIQRMPADSHGRTG